MRLMDAVRLAMGAMADRKVRAALTIIGIVIGPATIVALVGATQGFSNASAAQFQKLGSTTIFESGSTNMTQADINEILGLSGVSAVVPYVTLNGQINEAGTPTGVQIVATDLSELSKVIPSLGLGEGTLPPSSSDQTGAVLGYSVAHPGTAGATNLAVDEVLTVSNVQANLGIVGVSGGAIFAQARPNSGAPVTRTFVVNGVYSPFGQGFIIDPDSTIFVPLAVAQGITHEYTYNSMLIEASSPGTVNKVVSEVKKLFPDIGLNTASSFLGIQQSVTQGIGALLETVGGVSVLVAFIGIMTTMFTSVLERTREIGVLKALGATGKNIMTAFLSEALLVGFLGGLAGAGAGTALSFLVVFLLGGGGASPGGGKGVPIGNGPSSIGDTGSTIAITPAITPELLLGAIALATIVGVIAGLYPAWRASKMPPVEALRSM